jgi:hypothetical protein
MQATAARGWIQIAACPCGHMAPIPVDRLIKRYGELLPVDQAMMRLRCAKCGEVGTAKAKNMRLCEPGCPKQRG